MYTTYVLRLVHGRYYVGKTARNVQDRFKEHLEGRGSKWTQMYPPMSLERSIPMKAMTDEDALTKELMLEHGIEKVRGGAYTEIELSPQQHGALVHELRSMRGQCIQCGEYGHFRDQCPKLTSSTGVAAARDTHIYEHSYESNNTPSVEFSNYSSTPTMRQFIQAGEAFIPIANLNIRKSYWKIKARITKKSELRSWSNIKGEGLYFWIKLLDNSGVDIRGTFFKEAVDKFYDMLQVGKVYRVTGGRLKVANIKNKYCKSSFEIIFDQNTKVHLDSYDDEAIPLNAPYLFVKIVDIFDHEPNTIIDVLAVVKSVGEINRISSRKTGEELEKCDWILVDDSGAEIILTLWRTKALEAAKKFRAQPVVAFRGLRISQSGNLALGFGTSAVVHPPEGEALAHWWKSSGQDRIASSWCLAGNDGEQASSSIERDNIAFNKTNYFETEKAPQFLSSRKVMAVNPGIQHITLKTSLVTVKQDRKW